jgi:hypothetical protein
MRRFLLITATALAFTAAPAMAQEIVNFNVEGTYADGRTYGGTARITWISDSTCQIVWNPETNPVEGICMRNATSFTASYSAGNIVGLAIYDIDDEKRQLNGIWTIAGEDGFGTEILTRAD